MFIHWGSSIKKKKDTCNTSTMEKARGQCKEQENLSRKNWIGKYKDNNFEMYPGPDYAREQASRLRERVKEGVMVVEEMVVQNRGRPEPATSYQQPTTYQQFGSGTGSGSANKFSGLVPVLAGKCRNLLTSCR